MLAPDAGAEPASSSWTEERIERLKQLWAEGLSGRQIAAALGGLTRCAVLGKAHRLRLPHRERTVAPRVPKLPRQSLGERLIKAAKEGRTIARGEVAAAAAKILLELTPTSCRWPIGDPMTPEFRFCGADKLEHFSYCPYHCCVAYRPA